MEKYLVIFFISVIAYMLWSGLCYIFSYRFSFTAESYRNHLSTVDISKSSSSQNNSHIFCLFVVDIAVVTTSQQAALGS